MKTTLRRLILGSSLLFPSALFAGQNLGPVMFLGDSITVGAHGTNAGYRGYIVQDFLGAGDTLTTVGAAQGDSAYLDTLGGPPGQPNAYIQHEGHSGATIQDVLNTYIQPALQNAQPNLVYLMIGSNNQMGADTLNSAAQNQAANLTAELQLITYIHDHDTSLQKIYVEPPPSYPTDANYTAYSSLLGAALLTSPYNSYTTFVNSRPHLTSDDFYHDTQYETGDLHPIDSGYQIIATDLFNATAVPEPSTLGILGIASGMLLRRRRSRSAFPLKSTDIH